MPEGVSDENFLNSFINEPIEEKEDKKDIKEEELDDEGNPIEKELEEKEEEEEEEKEEEEEDNTSNIKPLMASIKEKYPNLFKEFPDLKENFFRARAFSSVFATPEEAKEAFADNEAYLSLRESALSGDPSAILSTLKETDSDALENFSRTFLPNLHKLDANLYAETTLPILQNSIRYVYDDAKRHNNEELMAAVSLFADSLGIKGAETGEKNFVKPLKEIKEDPNEVREAFNGAVGTVTEGITKSLTIDIRRGLDPENALPAFTRKHVIAETLTGISKALEHDKSFMSAQAARWKRAQREGFDEQSQRKIINAYLARAKSLMPSVRRKVLEQAVGDNKRSTDSRVRNIKDKTPQKREIVSGRDSRQGSKGPVDSSKIDWSKTSDMDLLNGNITYRS